MFDWRHRAIADKHSVVLLRQPLLANVLKQPFNSTQRITDLIKQAEEKSTMLLEKEGKLPVHVTSQPKAKG